MLLDIWKVYDTVDREFISETLHQFGFGQQYGEISRSMHTGTSARFAANGEISVTIRVESGIR